MLVFKKNIYYSPYPSTLSRQNHSGLYNEQGPSPFPYALIHHALQSDQKFFEELSQLQNQEARSRLDVLFPHVAKFCNPEILQSISYILWEGLRNTQSWLRMNAYHFIYLYDTLSSLVEDYSYGEPAQRSALCPEMRAQPINFNQFLNEYFFNTIFLIDRNRYNSMSPEEKKSLGKFDHALMGAVPSGYPLPLDQDPILDHVINQIPPDKNDITLNPAQDTPYPFN